MNAPKNMHVIENIQLEPFERAVIERNYEEAGQMLFKMLRQLRTGAEFAGYSTDSATKTVLYTRMASAVFTLLADQHFPLSEEGFIILSGEHSAFDLLFRASAFQSSDHMLPIISTLGDENSGTRDLKFEDPSRLIKFMLTYSLRSRLGLKFGKMFSTSPQVMFPLYTAMLSHILTLDPVAQGKREELLELAHMFSHVELNDLMLSMISDAYMYSSYGLTPKRHEVKRVIHELASRMLYARGAITEEVQPGAVSGAERPTIVIPLDWFTTLHAMYRCWAPAIRQLRKKFRLVAFSQKGAIDEDAKKEFDEWVEVASDNVVLSEIVKKIRSYKPDIIYYPSVGMNTIWVMLASVRLAPIQVMTLGHPSSTFSPCMDYVIGDKGTFTDPALFSERIVELPEGSLFNFVMRPDAVWHELPEKRERGGVVKIAIPAMLCKVTAPFIAMLKRVEQRVAPRPVEFHFFPNMVGLIMHQTARELREQLPTAFIYERNSYEAYTQYLSQCDLHLSTYPFGGTNSNIDSMKAGVPLLCREGQEPFERFDAVMLRKIDWPEWCTAKTEKEYEDNIVLLIKNDDQRHALRQRLLDTDLEGVFFKAEENDNFLKAMEKIYEQSSDLR